MHRKDPLDAHSEADAPDRKALTRQLTAAAHDHALKRLDAFLVPLALLQAHVHANRVTGSENGMILANLGRLHLSENRLHGDYSRQNRPGGASTQRTIPDYIESAPICLPEFARSIPLAFAGHSAVRTSLPKPLYQPGESPRVRISVRSSVGGARRVISPRQLAASRTARPRTAPRSRGFFRPRS